MELQEHPIFVNSVYTTYLDSIAHQNIIQSVEYIEDNQKTEKRSNRGGFQSSPFSGNNFDNATTMHLFNNFIVPAARKIGKAWDLPVDMENFSYWYNINQKFNYNMPHPHPGAYISGAYYIKVPADSGNLVFQRSRDETDRLTFINLKSIELGIETNNSRTNSEHWFYPQEGLLVMFPGHLIHSVDQNLTNDVDDRRISLSFNFF
jgi:uncharacterized protein (TIGR02466 family)